MNRRALVFLGFAVAFLVLTTGCEDFLTLDDFSSGSGPAPAPKSVNDPALANDPAIQAAKDATQAIKDIRDADAALAASLKNRNLDGIDKARELRPYDAKFAFYDIAMRDAMGGSLVTGGAERREAFLLLRLRNPKASERELLNLFYLNLAEATLATRNSFSTGSKEFSSATGDYCFYRNLLDRTSTLPKDFCNEK